MNVDSTLGALVPLWIIGAPFLYGLFQMFTTPKPTRRRDADADDRSLRMASSYAGAQPARI